MEKDLISHTGRKKVCVHQWFLVLALVGLLFSFFAQSVNATDDYIPATSFITSLDGNGTASYTFPNDNEIEISHNNTIILGYSFEINVHHRQLALKVTQTTPTNVSIHLGQNYELSPLSANFKPSLPVDVTLTNTTPTWNYKTYIFFGTNESSPIQGELEVPLSDIFSSSSNLGNSHIQALYFNTSVQKWQMIPIRTTLTMAIINLSTIPKVTPFAQAPPGTIITFVTYSKWVQTQSTTSPDTSPTNL
jgi:hypothetical protein